MRLVALLPLLASLAACVPDLRTDGAHLAAWELPENDWPAAEPPEWLVGEGFYQGQVVPDFRLVDQHGDEVSLWQFYGRPVLVDISTMWCGPCQQLAKDAEHTYQDWREAGLIYLTVLPQNLHGQDPTQDDLLLWADEYALTSPVVSDPGGKWASPAVPQNQFPFVALLDVDLTVHTRMSTPTDANVRAALAELLGEP